jgi:hypothetical protein
MSTEVRATVKLEAPNLDEEMLEQARHELLQDVREIDGCTAQVLVQEGISEEVTKGTVIGDILIALASAGVLTAVVECIRDWLVRDDRRRIRMIVEMEDKKVFLDSTRFSKEEVEDIVALILVGLQK